MLILIWDMIDDWQSTKFMLEVIILQIFKGIVSLSFCFQYCKWEVQNRHDFQSLICDLFFLEPYGEYLALDHFSFIILGSV